MHLQIISLGAGVQSTALLVLNALGRVEPRATHAVFADTGGEFEATLSTVARLQAWSREHAGPEACPGPEVIVARRPGPGLYEYHWHPDSRPVTPLCVRAEPSGGLWKRDCTIRWKIKVVQRWLRDQGATEATVQLGISYDETQRMKESPDRWITNRWPLVELKLSRADCRRIIQRAGLPIPRKSACWFCPLRPVSYWQWLAATSPEHFEAAARLEDRINGWNRQAGKEPCYLSSRHRPLREAFSTDQVPLFPGNGADEECGGYCFT